MDMSSTTRADFEAWAKHHGHLNISRSELRPDWYENGYTNDAWIVWLVAVDRCASIPAQRQVSPYCWRATGGTIWNHKTSEDDAPLYDQAALDAAVAAERERICQALPGGRSVDPQWVADMVRGLTMEWSRSQRLRKHD